MKVIIVGAGRVGINLAKYLVRCETDVTMIDQNQALLETLSNSLEVKSVVGYGSHPEILEQAGAGHADLLIAATGVDEVNIVACEMAASLFQVERKIARIRNQSYLIPDWSSSFHRSASSIDYMIFPEMEVAQSIGRSLRVEGAFDVISLWEEDIKMVGLRCSHMSQILNTPLKLLGGLLPKLDFAVVCLIREGKTIIPTGDDQVFLNDELYFLAHRGDVTKLMEFFQYISYDKRNILIMGGGKIGLALATEIETQNHHFSLKIIEKNPERAEWIAGQLKSTEILCGDVLDIELLKEANIQDIETVISLTEDDKVNILASLLAKKEGNSRTMALLNNMDYSSLVLSLGIDSIISPQSLTISSIVHYIRKGQVRSIHSITGGEIEIIDGECTESSHIIGMELDDINLERSLRVLALKRANQTHILPANTTIRVGDRLILAVARSGTSRFERLFS